MVICQRQVANDDDRDHDDDRDNLQTPVMIK